MDTNQYQPLSEFLSFSEADELLTEEILVKLEESQLGNADCAVILRMGAMQTAKSITEEFPEYKRKSMKLATNILDRLTQAGFGQAGFGANPLPIIQQNDNITVKIEKSLSDMNLKELFNYCEDNPDSKNEAWIAIQSNQIYVKAFQREKKLGWTINGNFDKTRTLENLYSLSNPLTVVPVPNREKGERKVGLGIALGIENEPYISPLSGELVSGKDKYGFDWSKELEVELHKACVWGLKTNNQFHPGDSYNSARDLLENFKDSSWNLLLRDYWNYLDSNEFTPVNIYQEIDTKKTKKEVDKIMDSIEEFVKSQENNDKYWEIYLKDYSAGDTTLTTMSDILVSGVYTNVTITGMSTIISNNVIVLDSIKIKGMSVSGHVYLAPGARFVNKGMSNYVKVTRLKTWKELAKIAGIVQ